MTWHLVQTKPGQIQTADANLRRQGITTFIPLIRAVQKRGGRRITTRRPLFANYIFIGVDPAEMRWSAINSTYGVSRLVSFEAGRPAVVRDTLIEALRVRCDEDGCVAGPDDLRVGEQVKILSGPFADLVGRVDRLDSRDRVRILLDLLGQDVGTMVERANVDRTL